ncbi:MAG: glutamate 5-kinase [Culicoidibacterales bacterium]
MPRKTKLTAIKRVVIKVGTSSLTKQNGVLDTAQVIKIVQTISELKNDGYEVLLVTSGAVGAGMGTMKLTLKPENIEQKQALAAIGQVALTHLYQQLFSLHEQTIAQLLLTKLDFLEKSRKQTLKSVCRLLLEQKVIPIINENDAVVADEIKVGDNDTLSALVAQLVDADLLILLSDIDGLYTANPQEDQGARLLLEVEDVSSAVLAMAGVAAGSLGTGGMKTKLEAAKMVTARGIDMVIANSNDPQNIKRILENEPVGTLFVRKKGW